MAKLQAAADVASGKFKPPRDPSEPRPPATLCGAKRMNSDERCKKPAGLGTDHLGYGRCSNHGGKTPSGQKSGARAAGRDLVEKMKFGGDRYGLEVKDISAEEALLEEVRRSVAMVRWIEQRIAQWEWDETDTDLGGLPTLMGETSRGYSQETDKQAWMQIYREERAHSARVSKMCIDAGIAERMVRIAEDQGMMLANAIKQVLDALGLNPRQAKLVPQVVPPILRQITIGQSA